MLVVVLAPRASLPQRVWLITRHCIQGFLLRQRLALKAQHGESLRVERALLGSELLPALDARSWLHFLEAALHAQRDGEP